MLFVKQRGREGGRGCRETPLAPEISICAGAHPSSSPSPVPTSPTVTCGLHPCPLLPAAESSLTGPESLAPPPARVPGRRLQPQRPQTNHLMTRKLAEPVVCTQSPETPQQRPCFFSNGEGRSWLSLPVSPPRDPGRMDWTPHAARRVGACPGARRGRGCHQGVDGTAGAAPRPRPHPYQAVGDGLLPLIQVHVVVVVARAGVHGHAGGDGEQEAPVVP